MMRRKRKCRDCRKCIRGKGLVGLEGKYTPIEKLEAMMLRKKLRRLVIRGKKRIKGKGIKSYNKKCKIEVQITKLLGLFIELCSLESKNILKTHTTKYDKIQQIFYYIRKCSTKHKSFELESPRVKDVSRQSLFSSC